MRQAILLGNPDTRRTVYLKRAAEQEGILLSLLNWKDWSGQLPEHEIFLKIDPPLWSSWSLEQLGMLTKTYRRQLKEIEEAAQGKRVEFFNAPSVIAELLDKRRCKKHLMRIGLPVTDFLSEEYTGKGTDANASGLVSESEQHNQKRIRNADQLLEEMKEKKVCQIFIKPVQGSGAAGVSAFRIQPGTGRMFLYTCAADLPGAGLANTKKLRKFTDPVKIRRFLDRLLRVDCVVERWYAKAVYGGYSYDLRIVVQGQRVDYSLARLSRGPITNLQLNNHPLAVKELGLPERVRSNMEELCLAAAGCFPGLGSVGIDVLLERGSLKPRIIEMNAQGDLIYQDIYHENVIYRRQAERMKTWLSA